MAITYKIVSGKEADEYWKAGLLYYLDADDTWVHDDRTAEITRPSEWVNVQFAILLED